jgi:hypothetical protein
MGIAAFAAVAMGGVFFLGTSSATPKGVCVYVAMEKEDGPATTVSTSAGDATCPTMPPTNTSIPCGSSGHGAYVPIDNSQVTVDARICVMGL